MAKKLNPISGITGTIKLFLSGKINFHPSSKGKRLTMEDGKSFSVFRHVNIQSEKGKPEAVFIVRFKPSDMGPNANILFSRIPMMMFMGFPGFRQKLWCVDFETGLCLGIYEWQTLEDAENYSRSVAMRFMSHRSDPESVSFEIQEIKEESHWAFQKVKE